MTDVTPLDDSALVLETERLILRPFGMEDLDLAIALFTDPEVVRYVCETNTEEELVEEMPLYVRRGAGGRIGIWTIIRKDNGAKIGTGVLLPLPIGLEDTDWSLLEPDHYPEAEIEVGYMLVRQAWGQGFATETCRRLLDFGFEATTLDEIKAVTDPGNAASRAVLTKCGLTFHGMRHAYVEECTDFSITRGDWHNRNNDGKGVTR